jgi:hypothetical protein
MASRSTSVTATCCICQGPLPPGRPRRTCSDACRQAAWRQRHQPKPPTPTLPANRPRKPATVYECPDCQTKLLGPRSARTATPSCAASAWAEPAQAATSP